MLLEQELREFSKSTILYGKMGLGQAEHSVYMVTAVCTPLYNGMVPVWQGWAILEDFIAIPILGGQNCRELLNF